MDRDFPIERTGRRLVVYEIIENKECVADVLTFENGKAILLGRNHGSGVTIYDHVGQVARQIKDKPNTRIIRTLVFNRDSPLNYPFDSDEVRSMFNVVDFESGEILYRYGTKK